MVEGLYTNAREEIGGDSDLICGLKGGIRTMIRIEKTASQWV